MSQHTLGLRKGTRERDELGGIAPQHWTQTSLEKGQPHWRWRILLDCWIAWPGSQLTNFRSQARLTSGEFLNQETWRLSLAGKKSLARGWGGRAEEIQQETALWKELWNLWETDWATTGLTGKLPGSCVSELAQGKPAGVPTELAGWDPSLGRTHAAEAGPESPPEPGREACLSSRVSRRPLLAEFNTASAGKGKVFHYHQQRMEGGFGTER